MYTVLYDVYSLGIILLYVEKSGLAYSVITTDASSLCIEATKLDCVKAITLSFEAASTGWCDVSEHTEKYRKILKNGNMWFCCHCHD